MLVGIMPIGKPPYVIKANELTKEYIDFLNENVRRVVGHNLGFDLVHLAIQGITFPNAVFHDTLIYQKNLFPNEWSYGLKALARRYLGMPLWEGRFHQLLAELPENKKQPFCPLAVERMDMEHLSEYNAFDLYATEQLFYLQQKKYPPFDLEMDYLRYIIPMIGNGMFVDIEKLEDLGRRTDEKLINVESKIRETYALGKDFNFRSPAQLNIWFEHLGLKLPDTKEETLEEYRNVHPVFGDLLEHRRLAKLKGTSVDGLKKYIEEQHLVHSVISVHGAETSRSTSSHPNVQNTDPEVRPVFTSRYESGRLLYTDLSSIEYRLIAHISGEYKLIRAFQDGKDIHSGAFAFVFGRPSENEVERKLGKTCNYAGVYGCGLNKFISLTGLPEDEARPIFNKLQGLYPQVNIWKGSVIDQLYRSGIVQNLFGRIRKFEGPIGIHEENEAVNWIIQSSGHDILKLYIMESVDTIQIIEPKPLLINETHDSFTLDLYPGTEDRALNLVTSVERELNDIIEDSFGIKLRVPIEAKIKILTEWE